MFWVGLVVRLLYITLAHTYRLRVYMDHFEFGWEMGRIARAFATGYGFADPFTGHTGPTAWTPPLYPLLLASVFKIFGVYTLASGWVILALNSVFSAATAPAVYELAWRVFGRTAKGLKVALWSGWLWALYPAAMQYAVHWVWDMALTAFLFSWVLVLALRLRGLGRDTDGELGSTPGTPRIPTQSTRRWAFFGLLWGLIALSNSSLLTFAPFCAVWAAKPLLLQPGRFAAAAGKLLLAAGCALFVVSPWVARNWEAFHAFIPMRANLGAELYESVLPSHEGFPWGAAMPMAEADKKFQRYKRLGEVAYSKQQGASAVEIIRQRPLRSLGYVLKRFYFFWYSVPHPVGKSLFVEVMREINYAFLSVGGLLGLALAMHRRVPGAWLLFWAFAVIPLLFYLITVQARFRHPLEPIITVLIVYLFQSAELPGARRQSLDQGVA